MTINKKFPFVSVVHSPVLDHTNL